MKAWVSKIKIHLRLLRANTVNTFQAETAYFGNNWGNLISTVIYVAVQILFVNVIYSRVHTFAGYNKNEMYFLLLIGQLGFYFLWGWSEMNNRILIEDIRKGALDFLLVLPVPALWYVTFRKIPILTVLRDGLPNIIVVAILVNWSALPLTFYHVIWGLIIFIFGQIAWESFNFLLVLPAFWIGEAKQIYSLSYQLKDNNQIPWEGYRPGFQFSLSFFVPTLLLSSIPTSVMLGKASALYLLPFTFLIMLMFMFIKKSLWDLALKNYTSAS
ncbi:MAG: ABC-2 family transporter protein [Candidatus Vogelbacteria bacterium]|nr:ABC-2 family transporter protein [Candidatus Vogelbacteria bacterium]